MAFLTYLLQVSGCITLFYAFYYVCLSRLTFFTVNRHYLLSSLLLSFVIPLITIPVHSDYTALVSTHIVHLPSVPRIIFKRAVITPVATIQHSSITWLTIFKVVYAIVCVFLSIKFIATLVAFFINLRRQKVEHNEGLRIIRSDKKLPNGSFLNYIFIDDAKLKSEEADKVIAHEVLHVKLKHSADRLLGRVAQIILWFNPIMYLYARAIEQNHEFEVDSLVTENENKQNYAGLLLQLSVDARGSVYNNFSKTPLQQRITMLFNTRSSKGKQLVYLLILPLLTISFIAFANMKRIYTPQVISEPALIITKHSGSVVSQPIIQFAEPKVDNEKNTEANPVDETATQTDGVPDTIRVSVIKGVERLGKSPLVVIDGKEYPSDILYTIGHACLAGTGIWMPDSAVKYYGPKAKDGYVQIRTKNGQITDQTDIEHANLVTENMTTMARDRALRSMVMVNRVVLKKADGTLYDRMIEVHNNGAMMIDVAHDAKVAFFIDTTYYSEKDIQKALAQKYGQLQGAAGTGNLDVKRAPGGNLHGYESVMYFFTSTTRVPDDPKQWADRFQWEKRIPFN